MRKTARKYFIPHHSNKYKPHFLREHSVAVLFIAIVILFGLSFLHTRVLEDSGMLAAILPAVLANMTNDNRGAHALGGLEWNNTLAQAAQLKADDMAAKGYFSHTSPDGSEPWYWFSQAGYDFIYAGENLAVLFTDSSDVNGAWMNSPMHRDNILGENFTQVGIATSKGVYKGKDTVFVVQMFGSPRYLEVSTVPPSVEVVPADNNLVPELADGADAVVLGESIVPISKMTVPVEEDALVVAVSNESNFAIAKEMSPSVSAHSRVTLAGLWLASSPSDMLKTVYLILAVIIFVALVLNIVIEIRRQNIAHIALGVLLLLLIISFTYLSDVLTPLGIVLAG